MYKLKQSLISALAIISLTMPPIVFSTSLRTEAVVFQHGDNTLSASYRLPDAQLHSRNDAYEDQAKAVILFVHGDGPMNLEADGYYPLIWNTLLDQGFAIISWDKPGITDSTGNWLDQSMQDRQMEVRAAIEFLQQQYGYDGPQIGLLGFSQAGWVIPAVASNNINVGFVVGVGFGFAIDWIDQGRFLSKARMQHQ